MTENRENWLYPEASGLYFPHDGFIMRATDGKQYDYEEECELLNEYDKKYNEYRNDVLRLEKENDKLKQQNKILRTNVGKLTDDVKYLRNLPSTHQKENKQLKEENKELRILITTLKEQYQKFKARLNDLGVEYL